MHKEDLIRRGLLPEANFSPLKMYFIRGPEQYNCFLLQQNASGLSFPIYPLNPCHEGLMLCQPIVSQLKADGRGWKSDGVQTQTKALNVNLLAGAF